MSPVYNPGEKTIFTEVDGTAHSPAGADAWENWDVSGDVPANARAIAVMVTQTAAVDRDQGIRNDGSARTYIWKLYRAESNFVVTEVTAQICEIYEQLSTSSSWKVVGYWT